MRGFRVFVLSWFGFIFRARGSFPSAASPCLTCSTCLLHLPDLLHPAHCLMLYRPALLCRFAALFFCLLSCSACSRLTASLCLFRAFSSASRSLSAPRPSPSPRRHVVRSSSTSRCRHRPRFFDPLARFCVCDTPTLACRFSVFRVFSIFGLVLSSMVCV